jgi:hypothetical protein
MGLRRPLVWLLLALLVVMPGAVFASRSISHGDAHAPSSQLQHASRSAAAWRNFSTALVADLPRLVDAGEHTSLVPDVIAAQLAVVSPIFVPPRG